MKCWTTWHKGLQCNSNKDTTDKSWGWHRCRAASETGVLQTHSQAEEKLRCWRTGGVFRQPAHRCWKLINRILLQNVSEGCICPYPRHVRNLTTLPRAPPFRPRSTVPAQDPWLAGVRLRRQTPSQKWAQKTAREDSNCPFCSPEPRVTDWGRLDSGCLRKCGSAFTMLANVSCLIDAL